MASPFSALFARLRRQAGFETAYAFFHKNGGRKVFGCSFANYLRIENGSHLPKPARLPQLCALLRLPLRERSRRTLVEAYLESWLGSRDLRDWMIAPFDRAAPAAAPKDPARRALDRVVQESGRPVSLDQFKSIVSTPAAYWCYRILTTSRESYAPADLVRIAGLAPALVAKALAALTRARIARRGRDGRYASPLAGQFLVFPDSRTLPAGLLERALKYNRAMLRSRGRVVDVRWCGVRADARQLEGFLPSFREAVRSVNAYAITEKTEASGLFFVEGRVTQLLDF